MRTADKMNICDAVEFYGIVSNLLAALMKFYDCGGMRSDVFPTSFSWKSVLRRIY